jgi:SAM-dependent methyltransferase
MSRTSLPGTSHGTLDRGHKARLTPRLAPRFDGTTLFDKVARTLCAVGTVPRKELYEAWEVARRVRRRFRGGRVLDLACGTGLCAALMLILDDSSKDARAVDVHLPKSARAVQDALAATWPRLVGRVQLVEGKLEDVDIDPGDVVVSCHACGALTDEVLERALSARARVAVLPCCHERASCDAGALEGWLAFDVAVDVERAHRLRVGGYRVMTQAIDAEITSKNRLLLGEPVTLTEPSTRP